MRSFDSMLGTFFSKGLLLCFSDNEIQLGGSRKSLDECFDCKIGLLDSYSLWLAIQVDHCVKQIKERATMAQGITATIAVGLKPAGRSVSWVSIHP